MRSYAKIDRWTEYLWRGLGNSSPIWRRVRTPAFHDSLSSVCMEGVTVLLAVSEARRREPQKRLPFLAFGPRLGQAW